MSPMWPSPSSILNLILPRHPKDVDRSRNEIDPHRGVTIPASSHSRRLQNNKTVHYGETSCQIGLATTYLCKLIYRLQFSSLPAVKSTPIPTIPTMSSSNGKPKKKVVIVGGGAAGMVRLSPPRSFLVLIPTSPAQRP